MNKNLATLRDGAILLSMVILVSLVLWPRPTIVKTYPGASTPEQLQEAMKRKWPAPKQQNLEQQGGWVFTDPAVLARRARSMQDTRNLCGPGYPGPGGKADCELAKKLLADPQYIKS